MTAMQPNLLRLVALIACLSAPAADTLAASLERKPELAAAMRTECGACHMVYEPQMLPQRSWRAIVAGLAEHFGEDASLAPNAAKAVLDYLAANAADASGTMRGAVFMRELAPDMTPMRITETPVWRGIHRKPNDSVWTRAAIRSKSNCQACHARAAEGYYDEESVRIPK